MSYPLVAIAILLAFLAALIYIADPATFAHLTRVLEAAVR